MGALLRLGSLLRRVRGRQAGGDLGVAGVSVGDWEAVIRGVEHERGPARCSHAAPLQPRAGACGWYRACGSNESSARRRVLPTPLLTERWHTGRAPRVARLTSQDTRRAPSPFWMKISQPSVPHPRSSEDGAPTYACWPLHCSQSSGTRKQSSGTRGRGCFV